MPSVPMLAAATVAAATTSSRRSTSANSRLRPPVPRPVTRTVVSPLEITHAGGDWTDPAARDRAIRDPRPWLRRSRPRESPSADSPARPQQPRALHRIDAAADHAGRRARQRRMAGLRRVRQSPVHALRERRSRHGRDVRRRQIDRAPRRRPATSSDRARPGPEPIAWRSSPTTSEIARVTVVPTHAAASRPPLTFDR